MPRDKNDKGSVKALSERLGFNYKIVSQWKHWDFVHDIPIRPRVSHFTVLMSQESIRVAFRKHSLLSLADCLFARREQILRLSRSSLHRLFQRNGINKLLENKKKKNLKKKFKKYPIGGYSVSFKVNLYILIVF